MKKDQVERKTEDLYRIGKKYGVPKSSCRNLAMAMIRVDKEKQQQVRSK